jgi:hypothetical protein
VGADAAPPARPPGPLLLARVCGYWSTAGGACGSTDRVRPYIVGPRCGAHTPAALAGRPEPEELLRMAAAMPAVRRRDHP